MSVSDKALEAMVQAIETQMFRSVMAQKNVGATSTTRLSETAARHTLQALAAEGYWVAPMKATRAMTLAAENMGAGEAWAEDCWTAMRDAYKAAQSTETDDA